MSDIDDHLAMLRADKQSDYNLVFRQLYVTPFVIDRPIKRHFNVNVYKFDDLYNRIASNEDYVRSQMYKGPKSLETIFTVELYSLSKEKSMYLSSRYISDFNFLADFVSVESWVEGEVQIEFDKLIDGYYNSDTIKLNRARHDWDYSFSSSVKDAFEDTRYTTETRIHQLISTDDSFRVNKDSSIDGFEEYHTQTGNIELRNIYRKFDIAQDGINERLFSLVKDNHDWSSYSGEIVDYSENGARVGLHIQTSDAEEFVLHMVRPDSWDESETLVWYLSQFGVESVSQTIGKRVNLSIEEPKNEKIQNYNGIYVMPKRDRQLNMPNVSLDGLYQKVKSALK